MLYFVFILGVILIFCGGYLIKKENRVNGEVFQGLMEGELQNNDDRRSKGDFIKLMAVNQDLKTQLYSMESKLDRISEQLGGDGEGDIQVDKSIEPDYLAAANKIEEMQKNNMSIDEMAATLNMGKGEVLLIQKLLERQ